MDLRISQLPFVTSGAANSVLAIVDYTTAVTGVTSAIYFSSITTSISGTSGTNGTSGVNGTSGTNGTNGSSGLSGLGLYLPLSGGTVTGGTIFQSGLTANTITISTLPSTDSNIPINFLTRDSSTGQIKVKQVAGPTVYGLFAQTGNSTSVSATTVETTVIDGGVGTLSVPANGFSIGDSFRADFGGLLSAKNNDTLRIKVKAGSVILADSGTQTMTTAVNDVWQFSVNFTIRKIGAAGIGEIVSLGVFHTTKQSNGSQTGFAFNTVNSTTFDTTIPNTLNVTAQWSSNDPSNSIYSDIFILNKIY